jgi:hypothetical protein
MISQLDAEGIMDACKSLYDIFEWQTVNQAQVRVAAPQPTMIKPPTVKAEARRSFEIEAD